MQPSSLIFVLVVALWAVYLVQHWARRRDHLLTIRSIDRFSEAMRVLDHQRLADADAAPKRSSDDAPTRARPASAQPDHAAHQDAAPRPSRRLDLSFIARVPRRVRGLVLLTHLVALPILTLVALFTAMTWVVPTVVFVGLLASFGWVRQGVRAEREARRRAGYRPKPAARPVASRAPERRQGPDAARAAARPAQRRPAAATRSAAPPRSTERPAPVAAEPVLDPNTVEPAVSEPVPAPAGASAEAVAETPGGSTPAPTVAEAEALFDVDEVERTLATEAWESTTWEPRPVPRPTYTMKAKATPRPVPEADEAMTALPAVEDDLVALEDDLVTPLPRRATGS
ncbi:hypothetical protein [Janibacter sp. GXQ6167]|uniref:hypothetical protein n=1 Tax=Janibacter sp. GXQ6167 TaxID=3240791 RepID=UPI003524EA83